MTMTTKIELIERITANGRFSNGDSDIVAQTAIVDRGCRIVSVMIDGDKFEIVGERATAEGGE
jgi:hypothetical protein